MFLFLVILINIGALKCTDTKIQTFRDKDLTWLLENNIRGGVSSVIVNRYVKSDESKKMLCIDATVLNGHSMSQMLPSDKVEM